MTEYDDRHNVLDPKLAALQDLLLEMAGRAEEMVRMAVDGLAQRGRASATEVQAGKDRIDELEVRIHSQVMALLALQQPRGRDLRLALAVLAACRDIERIGDHAVNIARSVARAAAQPPLPDIPEIGEIADAARRVLARALGALVNRDADVARAVIAEDALVDALQDSAFEIIVSYMSHQARYIPHGVNMILVVQNLGRIGDLATNIAEEIVFLVEGRSIKHAHGDTVNAGRE